MGKLKVGDHVYVNGIINTMHDMGYPRVVEMTKKGENLPFNLKEGTLWHQTDSEEDKQRSSNGDIGIKL